MACASAAWRLVAIDCPLSLSSAERLEEVAKGLGPPARVGTDGLDLAAAADDDNSQRPHPQSQIQSLAASWPWSVNPLLLLLRLLLLLPLLMRPLPRMLKEKVPHRRSHPRWCV